MTLPEVIRELAHEYGDLAHASRELKIPYATLSSLEQFPNRDCRLSTLRKIAAAKGKQTWELIKDLEADLPPVRTIAV